MFYNLSVVAQIIIAFSIMVVWVGRYENIVKEFRHFGLPDLVRNAVGAAKISLATLLVVGIWYPELVLVPAAMMGFLMICAQIAHAKVKNPVFKFLPSLGLLALSIFIVAVHLGLIS